MNNEIKLSKKEIIGICEFLKIHHFENAYTLLDYITNLQQENHKLKSKLECYENGAYYSSKVDELEQENERLKEEYKNKLDKTLEVLQYELQFQTGGCYHRLSNLFDYLQNGSDDNEKVNL